MAQSDRSYMVFYLVPQKIVVKIGHFFGKIALNFDENCAKMAFFICYINTAKCMLEALLL